VIRRGNWKFYLPAKKKDEIELFDLSKDPAETKNLAKDHPAVVKELRATVEAWKATLPKVYIGSDKDKSE